MRSVEPTDGTDAADELLVVPPQGSDVQWWCLYTRPRHEKSLARLCEQEKIPCYLPLKLSVHHYHSGRKERWLPLFSGYLFCRADPEQGYRLSREENLLSLLHVYNPEGLVEELRQIAKALSVSRELDTLPYLKVGQRVQVKAGPFRGIVGVIARVRRGFRVFLNVEFIGRSVPLEVDGRQVEPIG